MKTLIEYVNETLENTLELEIVKILSDELEESGNETSNETMITKNNYIL